MNVSSFFDKSSVTNCLVNSCPYDQLFTWPKWYDQLSYDQNCGTVRPSQPFVTDEKKVYSFLRCRQTFAFFTVSFWFFCQLWISVVSTLVSRIECLVLHRFTFVHALAFKSVVVLWIVLVFFTFRLKTENSRMPQKSECFKYCICN